MILPIRKDIAAKIREMLGWKPRHEELEVICSTAHRWEAKRARLAARSEKLRLRAERVRLCK